MDNQRKKELGDLTILVIDDEPNIIKLYSLFFRRGSDKIVGIPTCKEGRDLFLQNPIGYNVVVTDLNHMPISGVDVVEAVRQNSPYVPCYIVTGGAKGDLEERSKALAVQSDPSKGDIVRYLKKPIKANELHQQIIEDLFYLKDQGFIQL